MRNHEAIMGGCSPGDFVLFAPPARQCTTAAKPSYNVGTTPSERRTACIRLLAEIDQRIAECEDLARQPVLADDEIEYVAVPLKLQRDARKRVEKLLAGLES